MSGPSCGWCRDPYCAGDHSGDAAAGPWPHERTRMDNPEAVAEDVQEALL